MALYRCGGGSGGGSTPTLITKNITENGIYNAQDDNADGYSSVTVNIGGNCRIVTQSDWDALSFPQKKAYGLTVIQETGDTKGTWYDYSNLSTPFTIRHEFYNSAGGNIELPAMDTAIIFQGKYNNGRGNYDNLELSANFLNYNSRVNGSELVWYKKQETGVTSFESMITKLVGTNAFTMHYENGYNGATNYATYGAIVSIEDKTADVTFLDEYYGSTSRTITLSDDYDAIICFTTKNNQVEHTNGEIDVVGIYALKYSGTETLYSDVTKSCLTIYTDIKSGAVITMTPIQDSPNIVKSVGFAIVGIKLNHSNE